MSLDSIIGAAGSVLQSVNALEHEVESTVIEAAQSGVNAISDAVAPTVTDVLQQVAMNPQWFGNDVSGIAGLLADAYSNARAHRDDPLWVPGNLPISTATQL